MSQQPVDFTNLPDPVPAEDLVARQLAENERYGGPEGGGDGD